MKVHILDDWFDTLHTLKSFSKLKAHDVTIWNDHIEDVGVLVERLQDAECLVLFRERTQISRALIGRLPNLKLISQRSVYPHVDVKACTDHNVLLCSNMHSETPSYAAAELTFGLILSAMRQIPQQMASVKSGKWMMGVGKTLRGRTLGLYGYGRIAKAVAGYADAFGMNVLWWASDEGCKRAQADGVNLASSRKMFFQNSDIISLHVRLKSSTKEIITFEDLTQMREDALFVNTSRAGLLEKNALLRALNLGRPATAAIDVFDVEPLHDAADLLLSHPRLIATPHIGYVTEDEFDLQFSDIYDQINAYDSGVPIHMINESVWEKSEKRV